MTIIGVLIFVIGWLYAIGQFGFFLGVGLGWIPAIFIAMILDTIVIAVFGLTLVAFHGLRKSGNRG